MNGLTNFNFHCNFFFKKGKLFWKNHVRRGKHLLIMLLGDFFKNSNVESCFSIAISTYLPTVKYPN